MRNFVLLAVLLAACGESTAPSEDITSVEFAPSLDVNLDSLTAAGGGLHYRDYEVGTGAALATGTTVSAHYTGWLPSGAQFDTSNGRSPIMFTLGVGQVISGWDRGLVGMKVGGRRQLVIPPSLGYGPRVVWSIPANSWLVFTVVAVSAQ